MTRWSVRRLSWALGLALVLGPVLAVGPGSSATAVSDQSGVRAAVAPSSTGPTTRLVLRLDEVAALSATRTAVAGVLAGLGGRIVATEPALGMLVVDVPRGSETVLARVPGVAGLSPDATVRAQSLGVDATAYPGALPNITRLTGAQAAWRKGYTGAGVDVAVIDTGVAPVPALAASSKVVIGPDLSFESQAPGMRSLDTFGHGTSMASIIAGRETTAASGSTYAADGTDFLGMAPDARIVSVKVGDHDGAVDVSQLIAAIDWVVQNRTANGLNIKVLNLSFGTNSQQDYTLDPLAYAAEVAWNNGIFVVASAGNDGQHSSGLADPAYDKNIFAVGAVDSRGTDAMSDDAVPSFSQHPNSTLFKREPDLVAPGVGILGAGVPGSMIYTAYPGAHFGNGLVRGSGTSQAAAVVSGAAALLYQKWPSMSPSDVKELLTRTATALPGVSAALQGRGELDLNRALASYPMSNPLFALLTGITKGVLNTGFLPAQGLGTLEGARGSFHVSLDGVALRGETDIMNHAWTNGTIAPKTLSRSMWASDGTFNSVRWTGAGFVADTLSWAGRTWAGRTWASICWDSRTWSGGSWSGRTWAGSTWDGRTWASSSWSGDLDPTGFSSAQWSAAAWS